MLNYSKKITFLLAIVLTVSAAIAQTADSTASIMHRNRLSVGTYGEAVYRYNFYSDNPFRYSKANSYKDSKGHGMVDIPHAVINLGYDFGRGWSFGSEIEFEHGGTEAAIEVEAEESGEFEKEIERGGEVAIEQFWVQKSFGPWLNVRAGHVVVPVGATNNAHEPNNFFGVYRPEGENTIMPCTWHETGVELWGRAGDWRYDLLLLPALNSSYFTTSGWAHDASASPYEYRVANNLAVAARVDNYSLMGLRIGVSGYIGRTFYNDIVTDEQSRYASVKGLVAIGAIDFSYRHRGLTLRGNADIGTLGDTKEISSFNQRLSHSNNSPYPRDMVGKQAYAIGIEAGYNVLQHATGVMKGKRLDIFARYDRYDSFVPASELSDVQWAERNCVSGGINFRPIPQIIVKAEGGIRLLAEQYNNEPWVALGITWAAMFD
ncbi:MAG: hypothetical protein IJR13_00125 [Bacteroidales bacterium]|nr:hypothetical protein [Bacteroidales bacterium]